MSRFRTVAALRFDHEHLYGCADACASVLSATDHQLRALDGRGIDLVVLSEAVAAVGMTPAQAEDLESPGPFLDLYSRHARKLQTHIVGSAYIRHQGQTYNAAVLISPDGQIRQHYFKTFPTPSELDLGLHPGPGATLWDCPVGRIGPLICFDLNMPELCRQYELLDLDLLVFPSMFHGAFMQQQWAFACDSFFVAALPFHGDCIRDPLGSVLGTSHEYSPIVITRLNLDRITVHLDGQRDILTQIASELGADIRIHCPQGTGCAIIYAETDALTAADIQARYGLETRRHYIRRARDLALEQKGH